ncbi:MAG: hypothetical protein WBQ55_06000 [Xanthobacteraceae bacterium]
MQEREEQQLKTVPLPSMISLDPVDGWAIAPPCGHWDLDVELGRIYADEIIRHARLVGQPAAITFVLTSMLHKIAFGACVPGAIEHGFCSRIAGAAYCGSMN